LFGYTAVMPIATPKKRRSLLPLLTVLFLFSYGLMTLLIVEQGATIQSQRSLIQVLMPESQKMWAMKSKANANKRAEAPGHTQTPSTQAPSAQVTPQRQSRTGKITKPQTQLPPVPASDLGDQRRALRTI
jgi:hypothetical protein